MEVKNELPSNNLSYVGGCPSPTAVNAVATRNLTCEGRAWLPLQII